MIARLGVELSFPEPDRAEPSGLLAVGGDLSPERLLLAYRSGIYPWTARPITWWSPDPRAIFELDDFHVPRRLAAMLRNPPFRVTRDLAFRRVMAECARPAPDRGTTWISRPFIDAYTRLHEAGHAHSVECWRGEDLAGGIYGVSVGGLFAGESMFHRADNASKIALCHLVAHLRARGFVLFDIQMVTPATEPFHPREIPRREYLRRLAAALERDGRF